MAVKLTATSFSSRKLQATVNIQAPLPVVWEALTDYDRLGTFIPSLVENRCLERRKQGCLLYQVRNVCSHKSLLPFDTVQLGVPTNLISRVSCVKY